MPASFPALRRLYPRPALASFAAERSGIAAVEFALFMPVLLAMLYAGAELVNAVDHQRKVNQLARTLADLTSQGDAQSSTSTSTSAPTAIALTTMQGVVAAAEPILAPYKSSNAKIQISAIGVSAGKTTTAKVCSTWSPGSSTRSTGNASDLTVPANYQRAGARYVVAEVKMPYTPILGSVAPNFVKSLVLNFNWSETVSWPVRGGKASSSSSDPEIILPGGSACS